MDYIDLYCERVAPGLGAEPWNAVSNLGFFVAAWAIARLARQQFTPRSIPLSIWLLVVLVIAIGIGSSLFHTFATRWAYVLDVVPIFLFQVWYLWLYLCRVVRLDYAYVTPTMITFIYATNLSRQFPQMLNGSLAYLPAIVFLTGLGIYHQQQGKQNRQILLVAAGTFLLALGFRTVDPMVCPVFSIGTHFLWHLLTAGLVYLTAQGLVLNWFGKASFPPDNGGASSTHR